MDTQQYDALADDEPVIGLHAIDSEVACAAWMGFRKGRQLGWRDPRQARRELAEAHHQFLSIGQCAPAQLVLCARIEVELHRWGDPAILGNLVQGMDPASLLQQTCTEDAPQALLALACTSAALALTDPHHPRIAALVLRAYQLLGKVADASARLRSAAKLLTCTPWLPTGVPMSLVREFDALCASTEISVLARIEWCCAAAWWQLEWGGRLDAAQANLDTGLLLSGELALARATYRLNLLQARLHIIRRRHLDAVDLMSRLAGQPDAGDEHEKAQIAVLKAHLCAAAGDVVSASALAHDLCNSQKVLAARQLERCRFAQTMAALCAGAGSATLAREWSLLALSWACAGERERARVAHELIELVLAIAEGECAASAVKLAEALSAHQRGFMGGLFVNATAFASKVAELSLEANADPAYVHEVIQAQHLNPPGRACGAWPWKVKVSVLGGVSVAVNGQAVATGGRAQRLIELLRILAAAGAAGRSQQALERHLWSGSDGPKAALAVALHRLRKLLGNDQAIVANSGVLSLCGQHVWTDVDAMLELCERIEDMPADTPRPAVQRLASQLFSLYQGPLDHEGDDPWLVSCGARVRANFIAAADVLARRLEAFDAWHSAGRLYRRMLDAEPLSETAYRGLMRVAQAQGDLAAAFAHYRFCRDTLSIVLNRAPSRETRELAQVLGLFEQNAWPAREVASKLKTPARAQLRVFPRDECADL